MYILGINAYHGDAAAALVRDGKLIAAAEEERFNRFKHAAGFPEQAIRYCLHTAGISVEDLDHVGISRDPSAHLHKKVLFAAQRGLYTAAEWEKWLQKISAPPPSADPTAAFRTQAGLARRHNLHAFMNALYVNAREGGDKNVEVLVIPLQTVIKALR